MAKAPHPAAQIALKEPEDEQEMETATEGSETPSTDNEDGQTADADGQGDDGETTGRITLSPGWFSMAIAPTSGKPIQLAGLVVGFPVTCAAYCHNSRRYTGSAARWVDFREWRILNTPDVVPFEPLAWTRYE